MSPRLLDLLQEKNELDAFLSRCLELPSPEPDRVTPGPEQPDSLLAEPRTAAEEERRPKVIEEPIQAQAAQPHVREAQAAPAEPGQAGLRREGPAAAEIIEENIYDAFRSGPETEQKIPEKPAEPPQATQPAGPEAEPPQPLTESPPAPAERADDASQSTGMPLYIGDKPPAQSALRMPSRKMAAEAYAREQREKRKKMGVFLVIFLLLGLIAAGSFWLYSMFSPPPDKPQVITGTVKEKQPDAGAAQSESRQTVQKKIKGN